MPPLARADLESLLRARKLDRTVSSGPPLGKAEEAVAATGITSLDAQLPGGFPRGQVSQLVGPPSSGRTSLLLRMLAAATARGELVALVDALDLFDPTSAGAAGIELDRLLWVRGHVALHPGLCRDRNPRALEQVLKALALILQAGSFSLVVFDVADAPLDEIRKLPFTTWLRLQRILEGSTTACVVVAAHPVARSAGGVTVKLGSGCPAFCASLFTGLGIEARVHGGRVPLYERSENVCLSLQP